MLRTRLYLGLLALFAVVLLIGAYSILVCRQLAGNLQGDLVRHYEDVLTSQQMRASAQQMANTVGPARIDPLSAQATFIKARDSFKKALMAQSESSAGTPREALVEDVDNAFQPFEQECQQLITSGGDASLQVMRESETNLFRVNQALNHLTQRDYAASREVAAEAQRLATTTTHVLIATIVTAFALFLFLGWRLASSILKPIKLLTTSVVAVGDGNLETDVPVFSGDELGVLAKSFNTMAKKLRQYREATIAKVLRTQRTMEATLTSSPEPVFVIARDGAHEVRNPAAIRLSETPDFSNGLPAVLAEPLRHVLETGDHYLPTDYRKVVTFRVGREDRHYLPRILAIGDKLTDFAGAGVILQDVTKFRLLDDAKTNLVGTVSHELKTPLTSLRMAVYLLLEESQGSLTEKQKELLETARDDADRLLRILDSLLDLARLEAGASALQREDLPISELIGGIVAEARPILASAGHSLVEFVDPALGTVSVDRDRIRHVFMNLLTNASKYAPSGTEVALRAEEAPLGFVKFSVRDHGRGIPEEARARIFERFYRVAGQEAPGAGIGLAIAREIVVAHGGTIGVASEEGKGSEFYFLLPVK